jgi:ribonuclease VapC
MVTDTSALIAMERMEADAAIFKDAIFQAGGAWISAVSFVEFCMVVVGNASSSDFAALDQRLNALNVKVMPVTEQDALLARDAFLRYGKGRHPARLNFGDCFSYALAKRLGEPLLFKGDDFSLTDVLKA